MKLYVGNLAYSVNDNDLRELFEAFGAVESATVISDRDTGSSKGFGFVEMSNSDAQKAMSALNGKEHDGRSLKVNEAKPREAGGGGRSGGGGGRGGYGGGGGGRGGYGGGGRY
ncbi:MAG TPA: RNA-binding protein [Thermoanaerobaculia bacterium]